MRKILTFIFVIGFSLLILNSKVYSQEQKEATIESKTIDYSLPYPGILPDHPLYFLKQLRDKVRVFITRDNLKKAAVYHLISDKKAYSAQMLSQNAKHQLAAQTLVEGEKDFIKAIDYYKIAKKQGSAPSQDTILKLKLSANKHNQIAEDLLKSSPKNNIDEIKSGQKLNQQIMAELNKL